MSLVENGAPNGEVEVIGTVTMVRTDRPRVGVVLENGREVESTFRPQDEPVVLKALVERERFRLRISGRGRYAEDGRLEAVDEVEAVVLHEDVRPIDHADDGGEQELKSDCSHEALWSTIDDLVANLPPEVVESLPEDGSEQHDHYIYGTRKRPA